MREAEQAIGLAAHRADDQDDLVSFTLRAQRELGNMLHPVEIRDRSTTEFLNDEGHAGLGRVGSAQKWGSQWHQSPGAQPPPR